MQNLNKTLLETLLQQGYALSQITWIYIQIILKGELEEGEEDIAMWVQPYIDFVEDALEMHYLRFEEDNKIYTKEKKCFISIFDCLCLYKITRRSKIKMKVKYSLSKVDNVEKQFTIRDLVINNTSYKHFDSIKYSEVVSLYENLRENREQENLQWLFDKYKSS